MARMLAEAGLPGGRAPGNPGKLPPAPLLLLLLQLLLAAPAASLLPSRLPPA